MSRLVTLGVCGLLGVLAFSACSDDEDSPGTTAGTGGTAGSAGDGGSAGSAGAAGSPTTGGSGGSSGAAGTGGQGVACPGCVRLDVPFTAADQSANYQFNLGTPADFSNAVVTVTFRVNSFTGNAGGVQLYVQNPVTFASYGFQFYQNLTTFVGTDFKTVTLDLRNVAPPVDGDAGVADAGGADAGDGGLIVPVGGFDKTSVLIVGFQVTSGGTFTGATFGTAQVDIDSITFAPAGVATNRTFTTEADSTAFAGVGTPLGTKTYVAP